MTSRFYHAPGLISVLMFEYFAILALFKYYYKCCCKCCRIDEIPTESGIRDIEVADHDMGNPATPAVTIPRYNFNDTFESFTPRLRYLLFLHRLVSFYYICGISVTANYVINGGRQWFYFTLWNVELLSIYYMLATCASIIGFIYSKNHRFLKAPRDDDDIHKRGRRKSKLRITQVIWSRHSIRLGQILHVLFQVCGGSAVFVTLVNFAVLNHEPEFWNISAHLVPLLTLLIELFLNNMAVRMDHLTFNLSWAFLYLIFIWPVVMLGRIAEWPYSFLELDTSICYLWYTGLVIVDIQCYIVFYAICRLRDFIRQRCKVEEKEKDMNMKEGIESIPRKNSKLPEHKKEIEGQAYYHDEKGFIRKSIRFIDISDVHDDEERKDQSVDDYVPNVVYHKPTIDTDDLDSNPSPSADFSINFCDGSTLFIDALNKNDVSAISDYKGSRPVEELMNDDEISESDDIIIYDNYNDDKKNDEQKESI